MQYSSLSARTLALVLALVLGLLAPSVALASHTANCSEYGFKARQMGYQTDRWLNHRYAIRATFDSQALDLCSNPRAGEGSASTAWVAIQGPTGQAYDIVQMGMGRCYLGAGCTPGAMQDGYAWGRTSTSPGCSGFANRLPTGSWLGSWSTGGTYSVVQDGVGNYQLDSTNFGVSIQTASICWTNDIITTFVESHDYGDSLGGPPVNRFAMTGGQFKTSAGGAWLTLPKQCNARATWDGHQLESVFKCFPNPGATRIELWTDR